MEYDLQGCLLREESRSWRPRMKGLSASCYPRSLSLSEVSKQMNVWTGRSPPLDVLPPLELEAVEALG